MALYKLLQVPDVIVTLENLHEHFRMICTQSNVILHLVGTATRSYGYVNPYRNRRHLLSHEVLLTYLIPWGPSKNPLLSHSYLSLGAHAPSTVLLFFSPTRSATISRLRAYPDVTATVQVRPL